METATQTLHRLTSFQTFDEDLVWEPPVADPRVVELVTNDIDRLPWFFKRYDGLPTVPLPRELPTVEVPALAILAGTATVPSAQPDLAHLGRVLYLASGVVRTSERRYGHHLFRAAGSAGGRFPLEVYVAVPAGGRLPAGVHWYDPLDHALVRVGPAPAEGAPTVVVTGVPWRTGWRYRERGYRHVFWDAGTMLSQLLAAADSAGLAPALYAEFPDAQVTALVGADGVHEWPVALVTLGAGPPAIAAGGAAVSGAVDRAPVEFPLVTAAQRAGDRDVLGPAWPSGAPADIAPGTGPSVETVILRRGSQRRMDPDRSLPGELLATSVAVARRGFDALQAVPGHWLAVHAVDGMAPGIYNWDDLTTPVRPGELRTELYHACMDQSLGRDAAFVLMAATDLAAVDDRGYRTAQLAAGLVEGRTHLVAYALEATATGMTFVDGLVPPLLGQRVDALLFTCVGAGAYRSTAGGLPGAPTSVRLVNPRD